MYELETREHVDRAFRKLARKNPNQMEVITKKIQEVLEDPRRFKPMHFPLAGMRRVHFGNFVLLFSIDEQRRTVILEDYEHHDKIYRKK
ncbi:MAG: type II toxin-antitoxin system RelE/ParE family toxin [Nitrososphaerales archaeon]|nr:type II toxin-antitoxin system RelE/ParE family toxin [Nitrososphaerales archaeon]